MQQYGLCRSQQELANDSRSRRRPETGNLLLAVCVDVVAEGAASIIYTANPSRFDCWRLQAGRKARREAQAGDQPGLQ